MVHKTGSAPSDHRRDGLKASLQTIDCRPTNMVSEERIRRLEGPCQHIQIRSRAPEHLAMSVKPRLSRRFGQRSFAPALTCSGHHFAGEHPVTAGPGLSQRRCEVAAEALLQRSDQGAGDGFIVRRLDTVASVAAAEIAHSRRDTLQPIEIDYRGA